MATARIALLQLLRAALALLLSCLLQLAAVLPPMGWMHWLAAGWHVQMAMHMCWGSWRLAQARMTAPTMRSPCALRQLLHGSHL